MLNIQGIGQKAIAKVVNKAIEYSPQAAFIVGGILIVGGVVMACKATLKAEEVTKQLEEDKATIEKAQEEAIEAEKEGKCVNYTAEDATNDIRIAHIKALKGYIKHYAKSGIAILLGLLLMYYSASTFYQRGLGYLTAYNCILKEYDEYRAKTEELLGDIDNVDSIEVSTKDGNKVKKNITKEYRQVYRARNQFSKIFCKITSDQFVDVPTFAESYVNAQDLLWTSRIANKNNPSGIVTLLEYYHEYGFEPDSKEEKALWANWGWDYNDPDYVGFKTSVVEIEDQGYGRRYIITPNVMPKPLYT